MKFEGTQAYVATDDLKLAVNAAITLERPLLVKGETGTGKTMLAEQLAESFGARLITWHIKSTTKAHQGLYEYDAVSRLRDSQLGVDKVHDVRNYLKKGKLWEAFEAEERVILLIDEIDKADIEFPNDLLQELDKMEFYVYEIDETIKAKKRPIIIITSNNEKELPDAFLRRCFFHYIAFPDPSPVKAYTEPNTSPNSSLNDGPCKPWGNVPRISSIFLRTWYQISGMALALVVSLRNTNTVDSPGRV